MSIDGANIGVLPTRALATIIGGKPSPPRDDQNDVDSLAILVAKAIHPPPDTDPQTDEGYNAACLYIANRMLEVLREQPSIGTRECYDEAMKRGMQSVGPTGFMVGWAANAARTILGIKEAENPAIVTIG